MSSRRTTLQWLGACTLLSAAPLSAAPVWAQSRSTLPKLCYLGQTSPSAGKPLVDAFLDGMRERGWVDGKTLQIEYRWAGAVPERLAAIADEYIAAKCDVIYPSGLTAARVVRARTTTIPIVSPLLHDPVAEGMAQSLSRPGGNVTGTSTLNHEVLTKRVQLLGEIVPNLKTIAVVYDPTLPNLRHGLAAISASAARIGLRAVGVPMQSPSDLETAFLEVRRQRCQALLVPAYPLAFQRRAEIAAVAIRERLPAMSEFSEFALDGGLASHGPDWAELYRRTAYHVDRILRGAKPGDLAIDQASRFDLVINRGTARALGLKIPQEVLLRAHRVIE
jgi:putative tryptophan/tyrosine transport system substrate-binding protein